MEVLWSEAICSKGWAIRLHLVTRGLWIIINFISTDSVQNSRILECTLRTIKSQNEGITRWIGKCLAECVCDAKMRTSKGKCFLSLFRLRITIYIFHNYLIGQCPAFKEIIQFQLVESRDILFSARRYFPDSSAPLPPLRVKDRRRSVCEGDDAARHQNKTCLQDLCGFTNAMPDCASSDQISDSRAATLNQRREVKATRTASGHNRWSDLIWLIRFLLEIRTVQYKNLVPPNGKLPLAVLIILCTSQSFKPATLFESIRTELSTHVQALNQGTIHVHYRQICIHMYVYVYSGDSIIPTQCQHTSIFTPIYDI